MTRTLYDWLPPDGARLRLLLARRIWPYLAAILTCYTVTLALFPGLESELESCRLGDWMSVLLLTTFHGTDLLGKVLLLLLLLLLWLILPLLPQVVAATDYSWSLGELVLWPLARLSLIPLLLLCALPRHQPVIQVAGGSRR